MNQYVEPRSLWEPELSPPIAVDRQMASPIERVKEAQSEQQVLQVGMKKTQTQLTWAMEVQQESPIFIERKSIYK